MGGDGPLGIVHALAGRNYVPGGETGWIDGWIEHGGGDLFFDGWKEEASEGSGLRWFLRGIRIRFSGGELRANAFSFGSAGIGPNGLRMAFVWGKVNRLTGRGRVSGAIKSG